MYDNADKYGWRSGIDNKSLTVFVCEQAQVFTLKYQNEIKFQAAVLKQGRHPQQWLFYVMSIYSSLDCMENAPNAKAETLSKTFVLVVWRISK